MDDKLVFNLNQAAIDGIRGAGATSQLIFVEGNSWTGAWTWVGSSLHPQHTHHNIITSTILRARQPMTTLLLHLPT